MKISDFMKKVDETDGLTGVGIVDSEKEKCLVIKNEENGLEIKMPVDSIEGSEWESLYDIATGKREPSVLQHMTRIVGYFSVTDNWNPSKIGELKDRQKGNYTIA